MKKHERLYRRACELDPTIRGNVDRTFGGHDCVLDIILTDDTCIRFDGYHDKIYRPVSDYVCTDETNDRRILSANLDRMMVKHNMTRQVLADMSGIDVKYISKYLNGESIPSYRNLVSLSKALECTIGDLTCER